MERQRERGGRELLGRCAVLFVKSLRVFHSASSLSADVDSLGIFNNALIAPV